ncbi:hypothetical protein GWN49_06825, partial [Candidatus Bathyarchaeota archaeon]|nr:hypothetical protein [Candidatus Bathyarchaeota archaeon]
MTKRRLFRRKKRPLQKVPDLTGKKMLFIGGLHRSGTSILHRLLRSHKSISGLSDTPAAQDEGQHLQTAYLSATELGGPGRFAFNAQSHLVEVSCAEARLKRDLLLREWGSYFDLSKDVYVEKSPPNLIRSRFLQKVFPESYFCFIVRHPIVVALATQKWSKTSIYDLLQHWYAAHKLLAADVYFLHRAKIVRYEDFVTNANCVLETLCNWLQLTRIDKAEIVEDRSGHYFEKCSDNMALQCLKFAEENPEAVKMFESMG